MTLTPPTHAAFLGHAAEASSATPQPFPLETVDLSSESPRYQIIGAGTETFYHGHPTTLLMPNGKTLFCVWTEDHGGPCTLMKRSDDGGMTWSEFLPLPENWKTVRNCPTIFRLPDASGEYRLTVYGGQGPDECMWVASSEDEGVTWSPMRSTGLRCVMPFCTILPIEGGKRHLGLTNVRRHPDEDPQVRSNLLAQSISEDGGLSWSPWRVILDDPEHKYCEPWVVISPDGKEWVCLIRENLHSFSSFITSRDEGATWSAPRILPVGLTGDRHVARYAPDGRLVVAFRDRASHSGSTGHFVAWVGRYEDLLAETEGEYRIKLLHSYNGWDCGYPGLECLPDGTFVATTYIQIHPGSEKNSVVTTRFTLSECDSLLGRPLL